MNMYSVFTVFTKENGHRAEAGLDLYHTQTPYTATDPSAQVDLVMYALSILLKISYYIYRDVSIAN